MLQQKSRQRATFINSKNNSISNYAYSCKSLKGFVVKRFIEQKGVQRFNVIVLHDNEEKFASVAEESSNNEHKLWNN